MRNQGLILLAKQGLHEILKKQTANYSSTISRWIYKMAAPLNALLVVEAQILKILKRRFTYAVYMCLSNHTYTKKKVLS